MSLEMKYFVLKPRAKSRHDRFAEASQIAMHAFASYLENEEVDPDLCESLHSWAREEATKQCRLPEEPTDD